MKICLAIPTYNRAALLEEAISSALPVAREVDIHVFDNASTDQTEAVVAKYGPAGVAYHRGGENLGYLGNINRCLGLAREYDWIGILHSDDLYRLPDAERLKSLLREHQGAGLVFGGLSESNETGAILAEARTQSRVWRPGDEAILRAQRQIPCSATYYNATAVRAVGDFDRHFPSSADEEYAARIGRSFAIVEIPLQIASYRRHAGHTMIASWRSPRFIDEFVQMRLRMNSYLSPARRQPDHLVRRRIAVDLCGCCSGLRARGENRTMLRFYHNLLREYPQGFLEPRLLGRLLIQCLPIAGKLICAHYSVNAGLKISRSARHTPASP